MGAHFVREPLIRTAVHLTREQREALAEDSAQTGIPVAQLIRDAVTEKYFKKPPSVAGWQVVAGVTRRIDTSGAPPPPRARLREWLSWRR